MRAALPTAVVLAAASLGLVVAPAASAAPAAAAPVALKSAAPVVLVGKATAWTPVLHVPGTVASWSVRYPDGSTTAKSGSVPRSLAHTFHKTVAGAVTLSVTTAAGRHYAGKATVAVTALEGTAVSAGRPLAGVLVSIVDEGASRTLDLVRTDRKGFWYAPASLKKASSHWGYGVFVNRDTRVDATMPQSSNHLYSTDVRYSVPAGHAPITSRLPRTSLVTGQVQDPTLAGGQLQSDYVQAWDYQVGGGYLVAYAGVAADGTYQIALGAGEWWGIQACNYAGTYESPEGGNVRVATTEPITGPALTLGPATNTDCS